MVYCLHIRKKVLNFYKTKKISIHKVAMKFDISSKSISRWLNLEKEDNLAPKKTRNKRHKKIVLTELNKHIKDKPSMSLKERAKVFNCSIGCIYNAIKKN